MKKLFINNAIANLRNKPVSYPDGETDIGNYCLILNSLDDIIAYAAAQGNLTESLPDIISSDRDISWLLKSRGYSRGAIPKNTIFKIAGDKTGYWPEGDDGVQSGLYDEKAWSLTIALTYPQGSLLYNAEYLFLDILNVKSFDWGVSGKIYDKNSSVPGDNYNYCVIGLPTAGKFLKTYGGNTAASVSSSLYTASTNSWAATGNLPQAIRNGIPVEAETQGYVYVFGGYSDSSPGYEPWLFRYSISGGTWSQLDNLPDADFEGFGGSIKISSTEWIVVGGNKTYKFDVTDETMVAFPESPLSRNQNAVLLYDSINELVYHIKNDDYAYLDLNTGVWSESILATISANHGRSSIFTLANDFYLVLSDNTAKGIYVLSPHQISTVRKA